MVIEQTTILLKVTGDPQGGVDNAIDGSTALQRRDHDHGDRDAGRLVPSKGRSVPDGRQRPHGTLLDFFNIYSYNSNGISIPTGHTFTITPEPATVALIGLGLIGLVLGGRRPSRN